MRELTVAEQRYLAVLAVIVEGHSVSSVGQQWGVSRQTLHAWLSRYEAGGLGGLTDRSHRPALCPHQMPAVVEAAVLEMRRQHRSWGPRRIVVELVSPGGSGATGLAQESPLALLGLLQKLPTFGVD
jgi:transposase-like protein